MSEEVERARRAKAAIERAHFRLDYLRRVHDLDVPWLNVVVLDPERDLCSRQQGEPSAGEDGAKGTAKRLSRLFAFGVGLSAVVAISETDPFMTALRRFLDEFEAWLGEQKRRPWAVLDALATATVSRKSMIEDTRSRPGRSEYFRNCNNPVEQSLDYAQVVVSLCEILQMAYVKLDSCQRSGIDTALRFDSTVEKHFFSFVFDKISEAARAKTCAHLANVDTVLSLNCRVSAGGVPH